MVGWMEEWIGGWMDGKSLLYWDCFQVSVRRSHYYTDILHLPGSVMGPPSSTNPLSRKSVLR